MLAIQRSAGVTPEVNLRECTSHRPLPSVNKAAHFGFETQRRCHQKSKIGISVAPQKDVHQKFFEKFYYFSFFLHFLPSIDKSSIIKIRTEILITANKPRNIPKVFSKLNGFVSCRFMFLPHLLLSGK